MNAHYYHIQGLSSIAQNALTLVDSKKYQCKAIIMQPKLRLLPSALSDLFAQSSISGCITLADRYGLMAALLEESLTTEEQYSIDRLLHAVHRGRLKIVDDLSALE